MTGSLPTLFRKVLIANRGEIAVRIIRACRELGLRTVAVYSDVDRNAMHVRYATEAYNIGLPAPRESYLRVDKIIDAAKKSGADAIHPGYGFLAERPEFAQACMNEDIAFIGPPPSAIGAMGDKVTARKTVEKAGVPIVPGTELDLRDDELAHAATFIGFPLLIKATAGGGGKGMRRVDAIEAFAGALHSARREAESAFGDGNVYLEKLVEGARHIEIQVMADTHGNIIHLGERDCTLQRRHQKLIEESPSPVISERLRDEICKAAIKIAKAVNYTNAGTVEFLMDKENNFYFIEVNTRLQVEHPVTEMVTGIDLVKQQIRIAYGERVNVKQKKIRNQGVSIECRIYAEDPSNGFRPQPGKITLYNPPGGGGVRVDSHVHAGYEIPPYYDSLISKLIVYQKTIEEAIACMKRALGEY